jgi:hypothetical protein
MTIENIKHKTHKLGAQVGLQKLRSDNDLSEVICFDVSNKRTFNMYYITDSSLENPILLCVPSQNGLLFDAPHLHKDR